MATKKHIQHVKSSIKGKAPSADDLLYGEIAINYSEGDEQLYIKNSNNEVISLTPDITAIGDKDKEESDKVLTLTATTSDDGKTVTIEGSADTYNKAVIENKIAEALTNGTIDLDAYLTKTEAESTYQTKGTYVTNVSASGTSPLTLTATTNPSNAVTITGSVDMSSIRNAFNYYSEGSGTATLKTDNIFVQAGSNLSLGMESGSSYVNVSNSYVNIFGYGDINISTPRVNTAFENGYKINVNTDQFLYNGAEVATVNDLSNYATVSDLSSKQNTLNYYSEGSGSATLSTSKITVQGGSNVLLTTESSTSQINVWNSSIDVYSDYNINISTPTSNNHNIDVITNKFTYNENEVATVKDLESKQDVDEALEEIRKQYPDATLFKYLNYWFDESSEAFPIGAKIVAYDTVTVNTGTTVAENNHCATIQVAFATSYTAGAVSYSNQTVYLTNTNTLITIHPHSNCDCSFFDIYVPCKVTSAVSTEGVTTNTYTLGSLIDKYVASYSYEQTFFGLWNSYYFEGGSSSSTVVIDGNDVTIPANTIVQGTFTNDISQMSNVNLKKIKIKGDVTLSVYEALSINATVEEVDLEFSEDFSRSFNYMFENLTALKRVHIIGSVPTSTASMFQSVGTATDNGCEIDIKGMDFSQTNSSSYMFQRAKIKSIDLSGHKFISATNNMFNSATVNYANLSGCTFNGGGTSLFYNAIVNKADLSGCTFTGATPNMFYGATVNYANLSGCTFNDGAYYLFYNATVNNADLSGCTFKSSSYFMFNGATCKYANVSGSSFIGDSGNLFYQTTLGKADISGSTFKDKSYSLFRETTADSVNLNGCTFEEDSDSMFMDSTINTLDLSGCKFGSIVYYMFQNLKARKVDVSGTEFNTDHGSQLFMNSTITDLNLSGCDLSSFTNFTDMWSGSTIQNINLNGVILPTDSLGNYNFISTINSMTKGPIINGSFGTILYTSYSTSIDLSTNQLDRITILNIFSALERGSSGGNIYIKRLSYLRLTEADIAVATSCGWTVYQN